MKDVRAKSVPCGWEMPLAKWESALMAEGKKTSSVKMFLSRVSHMARSLECRPEEVSLDQLSAWLASKRWKQETRRSFHSSIRCWWKWFGNNEIADNLPRIKSATPCPRPAPDSAVLEAKAGADQRVGLMLTLALATGARCCEICQVNVHDLDEDLLGPLLILHGKGDKPRHVPISRELASAIKMQSEPITGWLFPGNINGHLSSKWVGKLISRSLPGSWTAHTLRHRFATRAYAASEDILAVSRLLGHASVATTQRYVATDAARLRTVAELAA